jgi:hypothetical protein
MLPVRAFPVATAFSKRDNRVESFLQALEAQ